MNAVLENKTTSNCLVKTGRHRWLLLPIEAKVREFEAKIFLGCLAAERGYSVLVGHYGVINRWSGCLPRGMILEKNISVRYKSWLSKLRSLGYRLCVNDEESLGLFLDQGSWFRIRMHKEMVALVDYVFAWSEPHAELIQKEYPDYADKIVAVGTPRFDLLRSELRGLYGQEVSDLKERFGRFILLPSNFAAVINVKGDDSTLQRRLRHGYIKTKEEEQTYIESLDHERSNLNEYVRAFQRIRSEFPDHALIVRPHPIDDHEFWKKAIESVGNAYVVYEGSITPWLLAAEAIFHCGCSTGMEARIMERCSVAYHPHMDERFDNLPSTEIGPVVRDEDGLISFIRQAIGSHGGCGLDKQDVEKYICSLDGKFASEKMLDALDNVSMQDAAMNLTWSNPRAIKVRMHEWFRRWRREIRAKFDGQAGMLANKKKRSQQKWPGASLDEVRSLVAKYSDMTGCFGQVEVKQVTEDLFCLSQKRDF
ncbi:MAG: hypothetical protein GY779_05820 [Gammaproteobacteria bacterium]|nr:hypothetical protein [Gammaproteobacteria bacterium]